MRMTFWNKMSEAYLTFALNHQGCVSGPWHVLADICPSNGSPATDIWHSLACQSQIIQRLSYSIKYDGRTIWIESAVTADTWNLPDCYEERPSIWEERIWLAPLHGPKINKGKGKQKEKLIIHINQQKLAFERLSFIIEFCFGEVLETRYSISKSNEAIFILDLSIYLSVFVSWSLEKVSWNRIPCLVSFRSGWSKLLTAEPATLDDRMNGFVVHIGKLQTWSRSARKWNEHNNDTKCQNVIRRETEIIFLTKRRAKFRASKITT